MEGGEVGALHRADVMRMAIDLGLDTRLTGVRRLTGGLASSTHVLRFARGPRLVLKRYPKRSSIAGREFCALEFARSRRLTAPSPVALDDGSWFGTPAIVMEALSGGATVHPKSPERFLRQSAGAIAEVHGVAATDVPPPLRRPPGRRWDLPEALPEGLLDQPLAGQVLERLRQGPSRSQRDAVFVHGDFHPGNVVWARGSLSGLVDWSHAGRGDRWEEVSYFRVELVMVMGLAASDLMLSQYCATTRVEAPDHRVALADLYCAFNAHRWGRHWLPGYRVQGLPDLTVRQLRTRLTRFTRDALRRLDK